MKHYPRLFWLSFVILILLASPQFLLAQTPRAGEDAGPNPSQRPPMTGLPGRLDFQADLFAGRFGYRVPFPLAPGRHGYTPTLELVYNSANPNGLCGVGWDLDLGYIQRETRYGVPVQWSNGKPLPEYDDTKGFIFSLNGQSSRLVSVGNNQYRAEIQGAFLKFTFQTNLDQWLVIDKSGNQYWFGTNSASRMGNTEAGWSPNSWTGTYRWALCHVQTALGDTADYTYTTIGGMLYPLKLSYNGNVNGLAESDTVDFILQPRTNDTTVSYISGYRVEQSRRLAALVNKVSGQVVWSNRLGYAVSQSTFRSLLQLVTRYGTNLTSSLPPLTFNYSQQQFGFQPDTDWTNVYIPPGSSGGGFDMPTPTDGFGTAADVVDMDGDGLPDRVLVNFGGPYTNFWVQHNTGHGFDNPVSYGALSGTNYSDSIYQDISTYSNANWDYLDASYTRLIDINGDGYPDRITDPVESLSDVNQEPFVRLAAQLSGSTNFVSTNDVNWTNVTYEIQEPGDSQATYYRAIENGSTVVMADMNGDGLPDRVLARENAGNYVYTNCWVQFNTGSGFTAANMFGFTAYDDPYSPEVYGGTLDSDFVRLIDINGDGLPDRVMIPIDPNTDNPEQWSQVTSLVVEYNNGHGFEPPVAVGGLFGQYINYPCNTTMYSELTSLQDSDDFAFRDINGDGLPDLIILYNQCGSATNWIVQINQGTNFAAPVPYGPYYSQGQTSYASSWAAVNDGSYALLTDINGDGLPDRVMPAYPLANNNYFVVELSKGPFPDLLTTVSNGIGGSLAVTYQSSTKYDNRESTTAPRSRQLLPFPVYTVSSISLSDGLYPSNTTTYTYSGGKWNAARREFDGFATTTEVDPLGTTNIHWFDQAGGRDDSAYGEYGDSTNTIGKMGMEFRDDTIGSEGKLYRLKLNKVDEAELTGGQHFAFVSQTLTMNYVPGTTTYRATARQFAYDLSNGNLTNVVGYGEVTDVDIPSQSFTDVPGDSTYQFTTFASLANTNIVDKPQHVLLTSDSAGQDVLRESLFDYDGNTGNLLMERRRMCPTCYVTNGFGYDGYNNQTSATNEAGIVTATVFDSTYETFPVQQTVGGTFTSTFNYDARSGQLLSFTDAAGLVRANTYDPFFRLLETDVSTAPNGPANEWLARYSYRLGMKNGFSTNSVELRRNDGVDSVNGHITFTYSDGLGRPLQMRDESETNNVYRVTDTAYDPRGTIEFVSLPYFSTGTNFTKAVTSLGAWNQFDPVGRITSVTPAVTGTFSAGLLTGTTPTGGDSGSPVGASSIAYNTANDPWTLVLTDAAGKVHEDSLDAYGRTNQVVEVTSSGNYVTRLQYDLAGDLTNIIDNASNQIQYAYNDLGELVAMADPDMGVWQYLRDYAGRLRRQIDADGQTVVFNYDDPLGRLRTKQIYDYTGAFDYGVTNVFDTSGDPNFPVYPGQLYETLDNQGWQKFGHDVRGRVLISARYLDKNGSTYTNQFAYDDEGRVRLNVYPNGGPTVTNSFDSGQNLSQVKQVGGSNTVFYAARGFNALDQLLGVTFGNGVITSNSYYTDSARLRRLVTFKTGSTNVQDLNYTYDPVSDVESIADGVYGGTNSASITNIVYDDLHRLVSLTRSAIHQTTTFGYDAIGNITSNGENGGGAYGYGIRMPHAVKSANGWNYAYDADGNMLVRANERLAYDPENRLVLVASTNLVVTFGYDADGTRLWKQGTNSNLHVWIGKYYEEKDGKVLYHVFANGQTVCTFDKNLTNVFVYYHPDDLHSTAIETDTNGNKIEHYEYMAYGQDRVTENPAAFPVSRRFTGQVKDQDTGLYYYGARYYDPVLGRFIQPDTIIPNLFDPQSLDRYAYARDNPLTYTDPSGHAWAVFTWAAWKQLASDIFIGNTGSSRIEPNSVQALSIKAGIGPTALRDARGNVIQPGEAVMQIGKAVVNGPIQAAMMLGGEGEAEGAYKAADELLKAGKLGREAASAEKEAAAAEKAASATEQAGGGAAETGRGISNPFKGKSPQELDQMFKDKGFQPRGSNPINGEGGYVNPETGRSYHIDPQNSFNEPPHVDVNRPKNYNGPLEKKKFPLNK